MIPTRAPLLSSSGAGGGGYTPPAMIRTGAVGNVVPTATGYTLASFNDSTYAYLAAPKASGQWYWEATAGDYTLFGVTVTPSTLRTYGGYNTINAAVYNLNGLIWNEWGAAPASVGNIAPGVTIGFALDVDATTLAVYLNNVLARTIALTSITTPIYPMFAFQTPEEADPPTIVVRLGAGNTLYAPPGGFSYL